MKKPSDYTNAWENIIDMGWTFDDRYEKCFLSPDRAREIDDSISLLRYAKLISLEERIMITNIVSLGKKRYIEFQEKIRNEPRVIAQKFISKKNVREFIFKRDNYKCLKCEKDFSLTIDHIVPVSRNGVNRLYNLQTLCRGCNSSKGTNIIDYRKGVNNG